ncbi:MAG: hypothetical protein IJO48_06930, partial [Clostridia bacterium]|nr:hypothetical protein [Clostridia bacterium]
MFFKKLLTYTALTALSLAFFGCMTVQQPSSTSTPQITSAVTAPAKEKLSDPLLELTCDVPVEIDLNADGTLETVVFTLTKSEAEYGDYSKALITATAADGTVASHELELEFYELRVYAAQLDTNSEVMTLIYSCTHSSDDTNTMFLGYEKSGFSIIPCIQGGTESDSLYASFQGLSDSHTLIIGEITDTLGTYYAKREYELKDGKICALEDSHFVFNSSSIFTLKTIKELPVTLIENDIEQSSTLPVGSEIMLTKVLSDRSKAYFETADKTVSGYITLEFNEDEFGAIINGLHESEYFEYIPY